MPDWLASLASIAIAVVLIVFIGLAIGVGVSAIICGINIIHDFFKK